MLDRTKQIIHNNRTLDSMVKTKGGLKAFGGAVFKQIENSKGRKGRGEFS